MTDPTATHGLREWTLLAAQRRGLVTLAETAGLVVDDISNHASLRILALTTLARLAPDAVGPRITAACYDPDPGVRAGAAHAVQLAARGDFAGALALAIPLEDHWMAQTAMLEAFASLPASARAPYEDELAAALSDP